MTLRRTKRPSGPLTAAGVSWPNIRGPIIIGSRLSTSNPNVVMGRELLRMVRQLDCPVVMVRPKPLPPSESAHPIAANGHRA